MKMLQKYFLALVPPEDILQKAERIKQLIRAEFGVKYALKSPAHLTVKMPFTYNEAKESRLIGSLEEFLAGQRPFSVQIQGVGSFGTRVIFLRIVESAELRKFQGDLKTFCKRELHLVDELSDRNFQPHLTVAFKDLKQRDFNDVLALVNRESFSATYEVMQLGLLKRMEGNWHLHRNLLLNPPIF